MPKRTADQVGQILQDKSRARRSGLSETARAESAGRARRNDLLPELRLVTVALDRLTAAPRRVRKSTPAQLARICGSIGEHGFGAPVLVTSDYEIIDGHERAEAARQMGLSEVPCVVIAGLTPVQVRTFRISLNRIAERGTWDFEALKIEFAELIELDAALEITGFEMPEIDQIVLGEVEQLEPGDIEPDMAAKPISQAGDIWRLGEHVVACGDARNQNLYEAIMDDETARIVLTDVPFNVPIAGHVSGSGHREFVMAAGEMTEGEFADFNAAWMSAAAGYLVEGGLLATFIDWRSVELIMAQGRAIGLTLLNLIVWAKSNAGMGSLWRSQHELLPVFKKGEEPHLNNVELGRHGRHRSNVWTYPGASTMGSDAREGLKLHPTVKPVAMLEDALLDVTQRGDIVIDSFLGSGSTLIAAANTGRRCRGIELDPLYVDVVLRRWYDLTGEEPVLLHRSADGRQAGPGKSIPLQVLPSADQPLLLITDHSEE